VQHLYTQVKYSHQHIIEQISLSVYKVNWLIFSQYSRLGVYSSKAKSELFQIIVAASFQVDDLLQGTTKFME